MNSRQSRDITLLHFFKNNVKQTQSGYCLYKCNTQFDKNFYQYVLKILNGTKIRWNDQRKDGQNDRHPKSNMQPLFIEDL